MLFQKNGTPMRKRTQGVVLPDSQDCAFLNSESKKEEERGNAALASFFFLLSSRLAFFLDSVLTRMPERSSKEEDRATLVLQFLLVFFVVFSLEATS